MADTTEQREARHTAETQEARALAAPAALGFLPPLGFETLGWWEFIASSPPVQIAMVVSLVAVAALLIRRSRMSNDRELRRHRDPEWLKETAKSHREKGHLADAARLFALAGATEDAAICYEELGQFTDAANLYESTGALLAAARCFRQADAHHRAAPLFEEAGYFREAAQSYEKQSLWERAATCHYRAGQQRDALSALRRAGDPYKLGCAALLQSKTDEATEALYAVADDHPQYGKARLLLAKVLADAGSMEPAFGAVKDYLAIAEESDHKRQAWIYAAKLLELMMREDDALEELELIRRRYPTDPVVERRWRRLQRRVALRKQTPDSPELRLRRISSVEMPSELAPQPPVWDDVSLMESTLMASASALRDGADDSLRSTKPPTSPTPPPPATFRVVERVRESDHALVYRATSPQHSGGVLLKYLRLPALSAQDAGDTFIESLRPLVGQRWPHTVGLVSVGRQDNHIYAAYEPLPANTLQGWMRSRNRPCGIARAISLASQVCESLEQAHAQGHIHGALDPRFILIDRGGNAFVDDLGVVGALASLDIEAATSLVLPTFAPPELMAGSGLAPSADIYGLGALLYYLLTNEAPAGQSSLLAYWAQSEPPDPRHKNPDVPPWLATLVAQCLDKSPSQRPTSISFIGDALRTSRQSAGRA